MATKTKTTFIIALLMAVAQTVFAFDGSGTGDDPFLIKSAADWDQLAEDVENGKVKGTDAFMLTSNISVNKSIGTLEHPFTGTFDGGCHTLTVNLTGGSFTAPFSCVKQATIRHLHVAGTINGGIHSSGLVGKVLGQESNLILDCRVSAKANVKDYYAGGFIGHAGNSATTLKGCLYDGSVSMGYENDQHIGFFIGWCANAQSMKLEDCFTMEIEEHTHVDMAFQEDGKATCGTVTNSYCRSSYGYYDVGKKALEISTGSPAFKLMLHSSTGQITSYKTCGIQSYGNALRVGNKLYSGSGEEVILAPIVNKGYTATNVRTNHGALETMLNEPDKFILKMGDMDAVIDANLSRTAAVDFKGRGTSEDPYIIADENDWTMLAVDVADGKTHDGEVFRMVSDINTQGVMVGAEGRPFMGTFNGDNHKITFCLGIDTDPCTDNVAPFYEVSGATIMHLHTEGNIFSTGKKTGAFIANVTGKKHTELFDCHTTMGLYNQDHAEPTHGGFVGMVCEGVDSLVIRRCSFMGAIHTQSKCAGFVGYSHAPVAIHHGMFEPSSWDYHNCITYARMSNPSNLKMDDCYATQKLAESQGVTVLKEITVPEGVTYEFVGEPALYIDGKGYYTNGCRIKLTVPAGTPFNHWEDSHGCFISDPFTANGIHQLKDVTITPSLVIHTEGIPAAETERTEWGVKYRYLSRMDYHYYVSNEYCAAKGWKFESDDRDANLVQYDSNGKASEITAITGYDEDNFNSDGVQIHNDLVGVWRNHTHLGLIAPHAFSNSTKLETLYFKDTDANNYNQLLPFDFFIGEGAFENCPNFKELKMMQYTTRGDNHWEDLKPIQVYGIDDNTFNGCPKLKISVFRDDYQDYLSSNTWKKHRDRFIIYEATTEDFTVKGVKYHWYRSSNETDALKNDENGKNEMTGIVKWWNADFKQFDASTLLETKDANVYYAYIIGVNDSDIDSEGGTMKIFNDPGSYYNYKTIQLGRDAIKGNTHVKAIEFWQTNGCGENSYSEIKMTIPNGALQGCTNLKELRMFYYAQDGEDHWTALGPKDVIPGNNIFGLPTREEMEKMTENELANSNNVPEGFRILVATDLYPEFLEDPNWKPYLAYIVPEDYMPEGRKSDYSEDGLTYSYMSSPGGIMQTSQVVSQDVSWWTAPRIAGEVAIMVYSIASSGIFTTASPSASAEVQTALGALNEANEALSASQASDAAMQQARAALQQAYSSWGRKNVYIETINSLPEGVLEKAITGFKTEFSVVYSQWADNYGLWNHAGQWIASAQKLDETPAWILKLVCMNLKEGLDYSIRALGRTMITQEARVVTLRNAYNQVLARVTNNYAAAKIAAFKSVLSQSIRTSTSCLISSACWGGNGSYNGDMLQKGMRENILSNIHQVGLVGGGYVITTPSKNFVYHTYIKSVDNGIKDAIIYAGKDVGSWKSARTMTFAKNAFRNKTNLKTVKFHEGKDNLTSQEAMSMLFTIPDSAFVGCTNLTEFNTLLQTKGNGTRALGPENFILGGDSIFAGLDSTKFHIIIDPLRKDDFLANASWAALKRFFKYVDATPGIISTEYGVNYGYAYESNSIKKEHKVEGHLIEHTMVIGANDSFIRKNQGAVKLCNDIGIYNNYQLDYIMPRAFKGNKDLRTVSFTDLFGLLMTGDTYTGLDVTIGDSAFVNCPNLANVDLLYMVTDGTPNHLDPMTPAMIKIGKGVFDNSPARLKMMPQQVTWFEEDPSWAPYKDRFMPCVIRFTDPGIKDALKGMEYYDPAADGCDDSYWKDYVDYARIAGAGFSWLNGKFTSQKENIHSFGDFKWFESVGLDYVGASWFDGCSKLGNITLPSTIKSIKSKAFNGCTSLKEIDIPQGVNEIQDNAFAGCSSLNTITVHNNVPATLGQNAFHKHDGLKIYVPAAYISDYKKKWSEYAQYIAADNTYKINKVVIVTEPGQLAGKLGLKVTKEKATFLQEKSLIHYVEGPYAKYDSLTVIGPLNGEDVGVLRHMMGADVWDSDYTDGQLRYLNLWDADLRSDKVNSYNGYGVDEFLEVGAWIGEYMFHNCHAIETVILPKSVTKIGENSFENAKSLKRIAVGRKTTEYERDILQDLDGIEELALLTENYAKSDCFLNSDPWEAPIGQVWTLNSRIGDYMGDPKLTCRAHDICAPLDEDDVIWALADHGHFFPSDYLSMESAENIFNGNGDISNLDDFGRFMGVKKLVNTFNGMVSLKTVTLPASIKSIEANAFAGCSKLMTIHMLGDSVPELAEDAFCELPKNFQILVPKRMCKLYRQKWAQYASHINPDKTNSNDEIITVEVTAPNTLAQKLGLKANIDHSIIIGNHVTSISGDYSRIRKLKVVGPISGADLDVIRYLAGYCPWAGCRNFSGHLEYADLYDAQLQKTDVGVMGYHRDGMKLMAKEDPMVYYLADNELPHHALLRAYSLKTLILPKTCKEVVTRALQECEGLETLVVGDDCEKFNWDALDDDAMLSRMYVLSKNKMKINNEFIIKKLLCNNYNPTFDAIYVRPSLYEQYLRDDTYTGTSDQRTNLISKGEFDDDASFCAFASHAAATADDLMMVTSVNGWFDSHKDVKDLRPLGYTSVKELCTKDMQNLPKLEKVVMPFTLETIGDSAFSMSPNLRFVDFLMCDSTTVVDEIKARGFAKLGIDTLQTLVYMPQVYGAADGVNVVVDDGADLRAKTFRLVDGKDYCVPYSFVAEAVQNSRKLVGKNKSYSVFLPYEMTIDPSVAKIYKAAGRDGEEVTFEQVESGTIEAFTPYVITLSGKNATLDVNEQRTIEADYTYDTYEWNAPGYTMRGTLSKISNKEAVATGIMMLVDGKWTNVPADNDKACIEPFRAYIMQSGNAGAKQIDISFVDEETTGIEKVRTADNDDDENYYDVQGRTLPGKPEHGMYIYKGKKYVNK